MFQIHYCNGFVDVQEGNLVTAVQRSIEQYQRPVQTIVKIVSTTDGKLWTDNSLRELLGQIKTQVLELAVREYANAENWGGAFNRHHVRQVRWIAGGEGPDLASKTLLLWSLATLSTEISS